MITVEQAEKLIQEQARDFGTVSILFDTALGRTLAEDIIADRDLPPFNRVTMDGIAINYEAIIKGITTFNIKATQAAGEDVIDIEHPDECIEIMTGASLPESTDTIIPYEHIEIKDGKAILIVSNIKKGQNLHRKGADKNKGEVLAKAGQTVTPAIIGLAASVGKVELLVKKLPRIVIISSGDELVDVCEEPSPTQIRKSNGYTVEAVLYQHNLKADLLHIPDNSDITKKKINYCLQHYDVILDVYKRQECGGDKLGFCFRKNQYYLCLGYTYAQW